MGRKVHAAAGVHGAATKKAKKKTNNKICTVDASTPDATVAFAKIVSGKMHQLSEDEVRELFRTMDVDDSGSITVKELQKSLEAHITDAEVKKDLLNLLITADASLDGTVDCEEFRQALLLGSANEVEKMASKMHGMPTEDWVLRETLVDYLEHREEQVENCKALPLTLFFFVIFFYLVVHHLEIKKGHELGMAIAGNLKTTKLKSNYPASLWAIVAEHAGSSRISRHNQVVGGIRLNRPPLDPEERQGRLCPYSKFTWFSDFLGASGKLEKKPIETCGGGVGKTSWVHWPLDVDTAMERFAIGVVNTTDDNATDISANASNISNVSNVNVSGTKENTSAISPIALAGWRRLQNYNNIADIVADEDTDGEALFPGLEGAIRRLKPGGGSGGGADDAGADSFFAAGGGVPDSSKPVWAKADAEKLSLSVLTHNKINNWYTFMKLVFTLEDSGAVSVLQVVESFNAQPVWLDMELDMELGRTSLLGIDCFFLLLFLYSATTELFELFKSLCYQGCRRGWKLYLGVWNVIDWLNIFMVISIMIVYFHSNYVVAGLNMLREDLPDLDENRRYTLEELTNSTGGIEGYETLIEQLSEQAERVVLAYQDLRWYIAVFAFCSALKFLKAFRANPRLDIVTQTVIRASSDLAHFLVVFFALLMAFVLVAHILFGSQVKHFYTSTEALNTCFLMLLGYTFDDISAAMFDSGQIVGIMWAWIFNILMVLVLLNMVLAIIFDCYADIKGEVAEGNAPSLIQQGIEILSERRVKARKLRAIQEELDREAELKEKTAGKILTADKVRSITLNMDGKDAIMDYDEEPDPEAKPEPEANPQPEEPEVDEIKPSPEPSPKGNDHRTTNLVNKLVKGKWNEAKLLSALKIEERHEKEEVTLPSLIEAMGASENDAAIMKLILETAREHSTGKEEELTSMSLIDAIRIIGRIDANIRDVLTKMKPDKNIPTTTAQEVDEKTDLVGADLEGRFRRIEDAVAGLTHKLQVTIGPAPPSWGPAPPPLSLGAPLPPPALGPPLEVIEA